MRDVDYIILAFIFFLFIMQLSHEVMLNKIVEDLDDEI